MQYQPQCNEFSNVIQGQSLLTACCRYLPIQDGRGVTETHRPSQSSTQQGNSEAAMQCYKIVNTNQGNRETGVPDGTETFIAPYCLQIGIGHDPYLLIKEFASPTNKKSKIDATCMERYRCNALHCSTRS